MKIIQCIQGTPEWLEARRGIPSASQFKRVLTPGGKLSASADDYICELIAEQRHIGKLKPSYMNGNMEDGIECEPRARKWYSYTRGVDVEEVGFVMDDQGRFGCSPDGLISVPTMRVDGPAVTAKPYAGGLELKCPQTKTHMKYLLAGTLPDEYAPQVHGQLIVTGLPWVDFLSYCDGQPPLLVRVEHGEYTLKLRTALELFWSKFQASRDRIAKLAE